MNRRSVLRCIAFVLAAWIPARLRAEQHGTAADAKAMVAKAIGLYKTKGTASFDTMNKGETTGFRQGDIYIFVFSTGAQPKVVV
jgi:hypothetical protein